MSNKTPRKTAAKKTKSAPKKSSDKKSWRGIHGRFSDIEVSFRFISVILIPIVVICFWITHNSEETLQYGKTKLRIEKATTQEQREKGLGGKTSLLKDQGMLFVFESSDYHCFWMKDMKFPIDIIWLNENKEVVDIKTNLRQDSYPEIYCPEQPAKYVLEVNSGLSSESGVGLGSKL